ncbi:response regulator [Photobacterium sp. SDRW27]|uniref:response regulator n=1 Tax=Photobacterium obscurum TaxID=2829490 RepID=UPI0022437A83|nr:response regulator [Photobacterium obscurum]MCW8327429.1 response regulator [Photobacterium obscurum]
MITLITSVLSFGAGEIVRVFERTYLEEKVDLQLENYFNALSSTTIENVLTEDIPHLETILEQAASHSPELIYVQITNEAGKLLARWGEAPRASNGLSAQYQRTISLEGEVFGFIRLAISKEKYLNEINHHVDLMRYFSATSLLLLGCFSYFLTQYLLLSPIDKINRKLLSIQNLAQSVEPVPEQLSELERLNRSVNTLREVLLAQKEKEHQLEVARKRAEEANRSKTEFIATMSHEIRTPMNVILGSLDILKDEIQSSTAIQLTNTAQSAAKLLLSQLNDILDYSKLDANKMILSDEPFSPVRVAENVIALFSSEAEQKQLSLTLHSDISCQTELIGDKGKISQILTNLIGNALKFTEKGCITLSLNSQENRDSTEITFKLEDSGIGIAKDKLQSILEPFVQSDPSFSRRYGGAGMGLSISSKLLALMRSELKVQSTLGEGSVFSFKLILPQTQQKSDRKNTITPTIKQQSLPILLVEDSPSNQLIAKTILARHGFQVDTANNGLEAIQAIRNKRFALILMDLQMPEMNGFDACCEIRRFANIKKQIPIVAMTANVSNTDRQQCLSVGMDDFLTKPINKQKMLQVICYWLGRNHQDTQPGTNQLLPLPKRA